MEEKRTWWKEAVVYQIYPRSFADSNGDGIGDINGITAHLNYLKNLGIDVIWLSPIYKSPNYDNGYDISDYREIMDEFGTMEDFNRLLSAAHDIGIRVVMDLVVNHTSDAHRWFVESRKSKDNPYRDYYIWQKEPNNWGSVFSGSAWQYDETTEEYYLHLFSVHQPDLNWANPKLREEIFAMMKWWCDKGIDGFRMDVINAIGKEQFCDGEIQPGALFGNFYPFCMNTDTTHRYIREMNKRVLSRYDLLTVGETSGVSPEMGMRYCNPAGSELNMIFQFEHVKMHENGPHGKWNDDVRVNMRELRDVLNRWQLALEGKGWNSLYLENHDQPRSLNRFGDPRDAYRVVNAKMLATLLMTQKGTPFIYQGEELGMTNCVVRDLRDCRDVEQVNAWHEWVDSGIIEAEDMLRYFNLIGRDNARTPMQWDTTLNAGFSTGKPWINVNPNYQSINAADQVFDQESIYHYYQQLIALRRENPIIVYGTFHPMLEESDTIFAFERRLDGKRLRVICNFSDRFQKCELAMTDSEQLMISNYRAKTPGELRPYEAQVFYC